MKSVYKRASTGVVRLARLFELLEQRRRRQHGRRDTLFIELSPARSIVRGPGRANVCPIGRQLHDTRAKQYQYGAFASSPDNRQAG